VSTFALACVPPTDTVMAWLRTQGDSGLPASSVVTVDVGVGNVPTSDWWIVAAQSYDPQKPSAGSTPMALTWLTDVPTGGSTWISIGWFYQGRDPELNWTSVSWSAEQLTRGQAAQALAVSCLSSSYDTGLSG